MTTETQPQARPGDAQSPNPPHRHRCRSWLPAPGLVAAAPSFPPFSVSDWASAAVAASADVKSSGRQSASAPCTQHTPLRASDTAVDPIYKFIGPTCIFWRFSPPLPPLLTPFAGGGLPRFLEAASGAMIWLAFAAGFWRIQSMTALSGEGVLFSLRLADEKVAQP